MSIETNESTTASGRHADELLSTLADTVGARFTASTVFGTPVERDGVTVVPVASVSFGFGGGGGSDPDKRQEGEGGGAAGTMSATGYIELKDGRSRFVPIVHPARMVALVATAVVASLVVLHTARPRRRACALPWR